MDKRLRVVSATINAFDEFATRMLNWSIESAIENGQKVLPIVIDSFGGSVYSAFAMIDSLKNSGLDVITISKGKAMSSGALLLSIGSKRYATENSTIMIHEAMREVEGTASGISNANDHLQKLNKKIFKQMAISCNKPKSFFLDLIKANGNQDLFLTPEEALNYGLITHIGTPSMSDIFPDTLLNQMTDQENELGEDLNILMSYSVPKNIEKQKQEDSKEMDLLSVKATLSVEQKKPIEALETQLADVMNIKKTVEATLTAKEQEIETLKAEHQKKLNEIEVNQDKSFLDGLKANFQLSQADYDKELKVLNSLSAVQEAKVAYKEKLSKAPKVVAGAVPNEQGAEIKSLWDRMQEYAVINKLNLNNSEDYLKAQKAVGGK